MAKHPLSGSQRPALAGAKCTGKADPAESLEVTMVVRRQSDDALRAMAARIEAGDDTARISRDAFAQRFGASPQDLAKVTRFAQQHGLHIVREDAAACTVVLGGTVAQCNQAFDVDLQHYEHPSANYRGYTGAVHIPDELKDVVTAVLGLDNRPQARTHVRFRPPFRAAQRPATAYLPPQLASLYDFPDGNGNGQCIGLIELGGGYRASDLDAYFQQVGVTPPTVVAVPVGSGANQPTGDPNGADGEVVLDIEIAGAIAPGATLAVYFAPNSDAGFVEAVNQAVHDTTHRPSVISISWGAPESSWTPQALQTLNNALQAAAAMGVTVCVASGDSGSSGGVDDGADHVDFPASSPYVLACGGTRVRGSGSTITQEVVWNDGAEGGATGGGVSSVFALPAWQQSLKTTSATGRSTPLSKRGVPDVAGDADPETGYTVRVDGTETVVGGTSAVAPLWAGLIARINAAKGSAVGYVNAKLYRQPGAFHDITQGNNGSFAATAGWDACTGLGSPNGKKVANAL